MAVETKARKFLNNPADLVAESLAGLAAAHPDLLRYDAAAKIVVSKGAPKQGKVALISGGGSGHEPLHAAGAGPARGGTPGPPPAPAQRGGRAAPGRAQGHGGGFTG